MLILIGIVAKLEIHAWQASTMIYENENKFHQWTLQLSHVT